MQFVLRIKEISEVRHGEEFQGLLFVLITSTVLDASSCLFSSRRPQTCSYSSPSRPDRSVTTVRDHESHGSSGVHYLVLEGRKERKEGTLSLQTSQGISLWRVMCAPGQSPSPSPMEVLVLTTGQPQMPPTCSPPPAQHNAGQDADRTEGRGAALVVQCLHRERRSQGCK